MPGTPRTIIVRTALRVGIAMVASLVALPVIAVAGCATADEQITPPTGDSGLPDTTFGEGGIDGGGGDGGDAKTDGKPLFDADLVCVDAGKVNTCDLVNDLGSIALGARKSVNGNVPVTGGDVWYKVTFENLGTLSAHPHITLEGPEAGYGFQFEIVKTCARDVLTCGDDASPAKVTDFESSYLDATVAEDPDAFLPIRFGSGGAVYLRVFRSGGTPTDCLGFTLKLSN